MSKSTSASEMQFVCSFLAAGIHQPSTGCYLPYSHLLISITHCSELNYVICI